MAPGIATFLFEAANFLVLAVVLGWIFFRPVQAAIERRRSELEQERCCADALRAEAQRVLEEAEAHRRQIQASLDPLRAEARQEAERSAAQIVADARARADEQCARLVDELEALRRESARAIAGDAAAAAGTLVERLLAEIDGPDLDAALIRAACVRLAALPADGRAGRVQIETARPLAADLRAAIVAALGPAAVLHERVVPDLGAGARIVTAAGLVDASASGIAGWAERELRPRLLHGGNTGG